MKENLKLIVGMLKEKFHKATMSREQLALYDVVGKTMSYDPQKNETTLAIPVGADPKAVKKVKRQFELESGSGKVNFVQAPPAAPAPQPPKP